MSRRDPRQPSAARAARRSTGDAAKAAKPANASDLTDSTPDVPKSDPPESPARHSTGRRGHPHSLPRASRALRIIGPGLITGAADDDPSGIGTYSQSGAAFGYALLWTALYLLPLMIAIQEMCARIGLVTGQGLAGVVRRHYNRYILFGAVLLLFIANTINVGADLGAMVASVGLLVPAVPAIPLLIVIALTVLGLEIFVPYHYYARILKYLALSLLAYVVTGFIVGGDWRALLAATLVPHVEFTPEYLTLLVAIVGTTISPYLFFWQASEEVEENVEFQRELDATTASRRKTALTSKLKRIQVDTITGMLAATITFWFIIQTTAGTLHTHGVTNIQTAAEAAKALEPFARGLPFAGQIAKAVFALGIVGTGLLAVPVLAGSAAYGVAEAFGWHEGLSQIFSHARGFYGVIAASTVLGLLFNLLGVNPIAALVLAAVINAIVAVPLLALLLLIANNRAIMGDFTNGRLSNIVGLITFIGMGVAAIFSLVSLVLGR
ncbi:MAG TPA: divalent metal cation transporter [Ktedonobacterales bacterium]|nr:divalent metal cation transporter [Ktedonobacterales bacterium]